MPHLAGILLQPQARTSQLADPGPSLGAFPGAALGTGRAKGPGGAAAQAGMPGLPGASGAAMPSPAFPVPMQATETHPKLSTTVDQSSLLPRCQPPMHSLDEPLDLKLSVSKLRVVRDKRNWALGSPKGRTLRQITEDESCLAAGPGSPSSPPDCE